MAVDWSKLNFFSRLNARSRIFFLFAGFVGVVLLIYLGARFLSGPSETTGPSRVATAPSGVTSIQGGQLNPEYYRAVVQANTQQAQQAQISGGSALPTVVNLGGQQPTQANCNIICSDQTANVKDKLDDWVSKGKIDPAIAQELQALADKGVSEAEYAARLAELVRQGKLTPEQARELLEQYRKQHRNKLLLDSAKVMDPLIQNGQLPLDVANALLTAQKNNVSPEEYARMLQDLVKQGKISPALAQQLLAQYAQQRAREIIQQSIATLQDMSRQGQITPDVLKDLIDLETNMVPVDSFNNALQKMVGAGKLTPAVSDKILAEYKDQKAQIGPTQSINDLVKAAEAAAYQELSDLLKAGKIKQDVAAQIASMIQNDVSLEQFQTVISQLVQQQKLTPEIAQLKIADYKKVKGLRQMAQRLAELQGNNASNSDYADELKRAVAAGLLTPEEAARLMQEYQGLTSRGPGGRGPAIAGTKEFEALQQRIQEGTAANTAAAATPSDFAVAQTQAVAVTSQDRAAHIQMLMTAMSGQAGQLINAWQPVSMAHREGSGGGADKSKGDLVPPGKGGPKGGPTSGPDGELLGAPLVKAGTILFAVLDTTANSDYPDSPVLATIVEGKFKGAKLLGKLQTTKGVSGQMDRLSLNFTLMNMDQWPKSKSVTAYAIDPDTARTVMASSVNYHYLLRFGAIMATSFLTGYASAIQSSASTTTTGIFGTSTTHPQLSPSQKLAVALGQIGTTLGAVTQNYVNIPPTVKVDAGVGLGILFMADVT